MEYSVPFPMSEMTLEVREQRNISMHIHICRANSNYTLSAATIAYAQARSGSESRVLADDLHCMDKLVHTRRGGGVYACVVVYVCLCRVFLVYVCVNKTNLMCDCSVKTPFLCEGNGDIILWCMMWGLVDQCRVRCYLGRFGNNCVVGADR